MNQIGKFLFSMRLMAVLISLYAISIGVATFIENDFGSIASKAVVYNALWFEIIMLLLIVNLFGSIFQKKMYLKKKLTILLFHLAFVVILIGAFITRYIGEEGYMRIREGQKTSKILSRDQYLTVDINQPNAKQRYTEKVFFSPVSGKSFSLKHKTENETVRLKSFDYVQNAFYELKPDSDGATYLELIVPGSVGSNKVFLKQGETQQIGDIKISFSQDQNETESDITIFIKNNGVFFNSRNDIKVTNSITGTDSLYAGSNVHSFKCMTLHQLGNTLFALNSFEQNGKIVLSGRDDKDGGLDALKIKVQIGDFTKDVTVWGKPDQQGKSEFITHTDMTIAITYGAIEQEVPFFLKLLDFRLERYPGSNSPSSFESSVILSDPKTGINERREIFMNNVLKYRGYRFYQSSYDSDEKGTVLSVNKDYAGTLFTYLGYLLLTVGMLLSLFNKYSRFQLLQKVKGKTTLIAFLILLTPALKAEEGDWKMKLESFSLDKDHSKSFGELLIQDNQGRVKPINTLSSQILRKISRKSSIGGFNADQVFLGMQLAPELWRDIPMIKVSHKEIKSLLGISTGYISFNDLFVKGNEGEQRTYALGQYVEEAYRKKPAYRTKFDTEIIRLDERINICYVIYTSSLLKVFPIPGDEANKWQSPEDSIIAISEMDSLFVSNIVSLYFQSIVTAQKSSDWSKAEEYLDYIKVYQNKYGEEILPSEKKVKLELWYNKSSLFNRLSKYYALFGFALLILGLIRILTEKYTFKKITLVGNGLIIVVFILHGIGLAIRWYISGHAPWSNGYEALVYISWTTVLAGILFSRKSAITLPITAILTYLILHVAHLSWMDPEITNLVPVLKSVWLVIHVAIITSSYGFLALGALIAFVNIILMNFFTTKNAQRVSLSILKLTGIIEMTVIVGLYMLTIGTFLGGVWANESWGRYWGWDPKEAWALVTILVYAVIAHMRMIPGLKGAFAFNLASMFGFSSVIMTYFGVNFYLAGLHSYAKGDPLPIPDFIIYTITALSVISIIAFINKKRTKGVLI